MFKKEPHIKALSNLKNSDRKKLLQTIKTQTNLETYNFNNSNIIKQTNFQTTNPPSIGTIFTNDSNIPIWFKSKHNDLLYPTVFTCWNNHDILPTLLSHDFVIQEKLFNGANLMISGTIPPFDSRLIPGTLCGIASVQDPKRIVWAIGVVKMNMPSFDKVVGETGVAVEVIHHFEDELFKIFKCNDLKPDEFVKEQLNTEHPQDNDVADEDTTRKKEENRESNEPDFEVLDHFKTEDVDYFITRSLYYTITQDTKVELPISASNFISQHINKNLPDISHNEVNIKKTSWKKTAKFLKHFEKEGFLKLKGKGDDLTVVGMNKTKDELKNFVPYKIGKSTTPSFSLSSPNTNDKSDTKGMMYSETFYKPINHAKDLLKAVPTIPTKPLYTQQEIRDIVTSYINSKNLIDMKNKKMILLDDLLFNMVHKRQSEANAAPRTMMRGTILEPILANNFTEHYQIYRKRNGKGELMEDVEPLFKSPQRGHLPQIDILTEMKIGRKVITKVSNFEIFGISSDFLAADLRKLCSGSTTIGETMTSPKTPEVQVQGPHGQIIIDHLNKKFGVPTKWINYVNKLKNKKKRK
ncbi:Tma64p NDAI_0J01310 [Naumovozyma dairenensis CBS 421]|uniref:SUI1 domain-containing protein n=1 Tax=Naumovozyma dairenensis (strain ATCC 10597 / BCRC 20456 / CBS 421 / NBRC 0211 / NRRL Y-12639) TaxID=1071378 RepID=G0WGU5_NAUDC|nr:hypothetical protein NDAI_0J01310 [Naumovozyma dairenensis CBS 421]CCD27023.1 hypothetical protein NDAI_0J01310 [Naumovozyma dairenensis CBS 421]